ncbi:hypothetical protein L3Q82_021868 [Scortum barcoo]|uniref:Uncharacterized protein n=1 Tax=Scortum barcoo TaxID=214431 RepID=A0ACB8X679_9TELE|nr:hypothetical protein L3Q82_021868 [Scortum barcoo]
MMEMWSEKPRSGNRQLPGSLSVQIIPETNARTAKAGSKETVMMHVGQEVVKYKKDLLYGSQRTHRLLQSQDMSFDTHIKAYFKVCYLLPPAQHRKKFGTFCPKAMLKN